MRNRIIIVAACLSALAACGGRNAGTGEYVPQAVAPTLARNAAAAIVKPTFTVYRIPKTVNGYHPCCPQFITVDPKTDTAWFTCWEFCGGIITSVSPHGDFHSYVPFYSGTIFSKLLNKPNYAEPDMLTIGSDGALWFTDDPLPNGNAGTKQSAIGRMDIADPFNGAASFQGWAYPAKGSTPPAIASGSKAVWFVGGCVAQESVHCHEVDSVKPSGGIQRHRDGWGSATDACVASMAAGANGTIWLNWLHCPTANPASYMDEWTASGTFHQYKLPPTTEAYAPTLGSDGAIWYQAQDRECAVASQTEYAGVIGRIDGTGRVHEYCLDIHGNRFGFGYAMAAGSDGALWFTTGGGTPSGNCPGKANCFYLGRITTSGAISMYPMATTTQFPRSLASGSQHDLWMTDTNADTIVRIQI